MKPIYKISHNWDEIIEGTFEEFSTSHFKFTAPQGAGILVSMEELSLQYFFTKEEALTELNRILLNSVSSTEKLLIRNLERFERVKSKYFNNEQKEPKTFNCVSSKFVFLVRDSENDDSYCAPELTTEEPIKIERDGEIIWKHKDINSMSCLNPSISKFLEIEPGQCSKFIIFKVQ